MTDGVSPPTTDRQRVDGITRAAVVATVLAVLGVVLPPFGAASAVVAVVCSAVALRRARERGQANRVARTCLIVSATLLVVLVVGSVIYAAFATPGGPAP